MINLPFSQHEFLEVFRIYNEAIWPVQIIAYLLGIIAVGLAIWPRKFPGPTISGVLALFWLWSGGVYHIIFFSDINEAAYLFGTLFILEGILLVWASSGKNPLTFQFSFDIYGITGALMIAYAMIIYPLLGYYLRHGYPLPPMFGVAPCPMVIFTFGILLWVNADNKLPGWLLIIPGLWSLIGFTAALKLGMLEDTGLLVAGILGVAMVWHRNKTLSINQVSMSP